MSGWPHLAHHRWSEPERRRHYAEGTWGPHDLWRYLLRHAERHPDREAYVDRDERLSFADLRRRSAALAFALRERGARTGDVVAVQLPNWVEYPIARFAVSAAGCALLSLPPDAESDAVAGLIAHTGARVLVTRSAVAPVVRAALGDGALVVAVREEIPDAVPLDRFVTATAGETGRYEELPGGDADAVDLLMGTSGTTGTPKLVMRTANSFLAMSRAVVDRIGLDAGDALMIAAPAAQGIGYMHAIADAALTGCRVILPDRFDAGSLLAALERERVSTLVTVPTVAIRMLADPRLDRTDLSSLRCYQSGGAPLPPQTAAELEDRCGCQVLNMYGSLDVGIPTMTAPRTDPPDVRHHTVGATVRGVELRVVAADGTPLPPGEVGEVVMRGPNTAIGYYADDEGTARTFDPAGWGHFGDLGVIDADGRLRIVGRLKDVIIRGGRNISASEVEAAARQHPDVVDAAAVAAPDPELGERCVLFVVTTDPELDLAAVTGFLRERAVAKYTWPERLVVVDELPLDPQGKVRKSVLRQWLAERSAAEMR
jgi:acyl-CoA synthetase (AMP-forming)/AMP-acid ligase II